MKSILMKKSKLYQEKERLKVLKFNPSLTEDEENRVIVEEENIKRQLEFYREIIRRINDQNKQDLHR